MKNCVLLAACAAVLAACCSCSEMEPDLKAADAQMGFGHPVVCVELDNEATAAPAQFNEYRIAGYNAVCGVSVSAVVRHGGWSWSGGGNALSGLMSVGGIFPADDRLANLYFDKVGGREKPIVAFDNRLALANEDLLYAYAANADICAPLNLRFNHLLSQVGFEFSNEIGEDVDFRIENLGLFLNWGSGIIDMGDAMPRWKKVERIEHWVRHIDVESVCSFGDAVVSQKRCLMGNDGRVMCCFTVVELQGGKEKARYTHLLYLPEIGYEPGMSYVWHIALNEENFRFAKGGSAKSLQFDDDASMPVVVSVSPTWGAMGQ